MEPLQEGDVLDNKYRVERVLGRGGMGMVVAAVHLQLGQRVALKLLLPEVCANPDAVDRFLREARAAVQIQSEHVARVLDVGTLRSGDLPAGEAGTRSQAQTVRPGSQEHTSQGSFR